MGNMGQFGDTTLTKVFVGGLAWETQKETLKEHFERYGEILEAVIISDKITGRSKGYGFVTFKEAEGAKKACEDPTPVINGRRANCNLASLGARRLRASPTSNPPHHQPPPGGMAVAAARAVTTPPPPPPQDHWFYPSGAPHPPAFHHQYHGIPLYAAYGYSPSYMADVGYTAKLSHSAGGGSYLQSHFSQGPFPGQGQGGIMSPNGMLPLYHPFYHYHHQSQGMGLPAHMFPQITAGPVTTMPTLITKPTAMPPTQGQYSATLFCFENNRYILIIKHLLYINFVAYYKSVVVLSYVCIGSLFDSGTGHGLQLKSREDNTGGRGVDMGKERKEAQ